MPPTARCATYVCPPDDQWPRVLLPAWPPYEKAPEADSLVWVRGRGGGVARVVSAHGDELRVCPLYGSRAGVPCEVPRRKAELMRGRGEEQPAILLCGETESFRMLARSQLLPTDTVLEVGCSYGLATKELAARAQKVVAVDVSSSAIERASAHCAAHAEKLRFEKIDGIKQQRQLLDMAAGATVAFVDINGDRASADVVQLLHALHTRLVPVLTVVKNTQLYRAACAHQASASALDGADAALLPESEAFWQAVAPTMSAAEVAWRTPAQWRSKVASEQRMRGCTSIN